MNLKHWLIIAAIAATPGASALAQDTRSASQTTATSGSYTSNDAGQWLASGFVGSNFANNAQPASMNFGGSLAYFWKNMLGAELDASFTPSFQLQNKFLGTGIKPDINSYMANAIWSRPMGSNGQIQPFVSGGVGAISLRSGSGTTTTMTSSDSTRFGGDVGGGVMAFAGRWGFKADVRYLRATGTYNTVSTPANPAQPTPTPAPGPYGILASGAGTASTMPAALATPPPSAAATSFADAALAGLHFWRANVGVAVRW
jgi:hypothetical protein